jgi:hypothetical protein
MQRSCQKFGTRDYRPTYRFLRGKPEKQEAAKQDIAELREKARADEVVLPSRGEARSPTMPTPRATLGVEGHRPQEGTWDCEDLPYVFAVVNLSSRAAHGDTPEGPEGAEEGTGEGKTRRLREAFSRHPRHVGRIYPRDEYEEVVPMVDNAVQRRAEPDRLRHPRAAGPEEYAEDRPGPGTRHGRRECLRSRR